MVTTKIKKPIFLYALAIGSILGFLVIVLDAFWKIDISTKAQAGLFIILGIALIAEGQVRRLLRYAQKGFTQSEISHITAIVIGALSVIIGVINLISPTFINPTFEAFKGIIAIIAIVVIVIEGFIVK